MEIKHIPHPTPPTPANIRFVEPTPLYTITFYHVFCSKMLPNICHTVCLRVYRSSCFKNCLLPSRFLRTRRYHLQWFRPFKLIATDRCRGKEEGKWFLQGEERGGNLWPWVRMASDVEYDSIGDVCQDKFLLKRQGSGQHISHPPFRVSRVRQDKRCFPPICKVVRFEQKNASPLSNYQPSWTRCRRGEAILPWLTRGRY